MTLGTMSPATVEEMLDMDSSHEFETLTNMNPDQAGLDRSPSSKRDC